MPVDTDIQQFLNHYQQQNHPSYASLSPTGLRKWFNQHFASKARPTPIAVDKVIEQELTGPDNNSLRCRIYYPTGTGPFAVLMYFHGGGFVIRDDMDLYDQTCRMMCHHANCAVISVDFRLAPEHPFPAAPEDCYAATCWVTEQAHALNIDPNRLGVWGESCGGNLATVVAMMARDRNGPKLACQIIITAMLNDDFTKDSYRENGNGEYLLTQTTMNWFWQHYLASANNAAHPYCMPCKATNLSQLPPALVVTVEYDPLRDEGADYAKKLSDANVATTYHCYPGLIHGFFDLYARSDAANTACQQIIHMSQSLLNQL